MAADGLSPPQAVSRLAWAFRMSQAIHVAAHLGIADLLARTSLTADELARATDTHAPALYRLLRALASVGVFAEDAQQRFTLTPAAACLRAGVPGSLRDFVLMTADVERQLPWTELLHSVRTGETGFQHKFGVPSWEYRRQNPEANAVFNGAMTGLSEDRANAVVEAYSFAGVRGIVDVGGGHGLLLAAILKAHPAARGVLFDQPHVIADAGPLLFEAGIADRCEVVGGNFFVAIPPGWDVYVLKSIVHDWADAEATTILRNCRRAIAEDGKLLLVERVIAEGNLPDEGKFLDLTMLVSEGGRERTAAEFRSLLTASGFELTAIIPTRSGMSIVEGRPIRAELGPGEG